MLPPGEEDRASSLPDGCISGGFSCATLKERLIGQAKLSEVCDQMRDRPRAGALRCRAPVAELA
jgi:hypothetical protein